MRPSAVLLLIASAVAGAWSALAQLKESAPSASFSSTSASCSPLEVPTIDLASLESPSEELLRQLSAACREWGFFQIVNHGLDTSRLRARMAEFFALPLVDKLEIKRARNNSRGFANDELTKQKVDWKEILDFGHVPHRDLPSDDPRNRVLDGYNQWPRQLGKQWEQDLMTYYDDAAVLSARLLRALALSLNLDPSGLDSCFTNHTSFQRLNYYPVLANAPDGTLGISRHTDAGVLTLLWQEPGVASLQVYSGYKEDHGDGEWVTVEPVDGALTVNIGDMFHVFTGGLCSAPEHRVLANPSRSRLSSPFFYNPSYGCNVSMLLDNTQQRFRSINWGEFRTKRFEGDYEDVGEENQIEHYLIS